MYKLKYFSDFHQDYFFIGQYVYDINKKQYGQIMAIESLFDSEDFFIKIAFKNKLYLYPINKLDMLKI